METEQLTQSEKEMFALPQDMQSRIITNLINADGFDQFNRPGTSSYYPDLYTVNYLIPSNDNSNAKLFRDHKDSKKALNQALNRAEEIFKKYPNSKIWLTHWNKNVIKGVKPLHTPSDWNDNIEINEENVNTTNNGVIIDSAISYLKNELELFDLFIDFIKQNLDVSQFPKIHVLSSRNGTLSTYGAYDPNTDVIMVYGKNRGFADVLRTSAHELVHHWQNSNGKIPKNLKGRDTELESEANTMAGDFVYMFGLQHPEIYDLGDIENTSIES